jgi:hypothetical protein
MNVVSRGFAGRERNEPKLPPGQYLERGFPVLQAGSTAIGVLSVPWVLASCLLWPDCH